MNDHPKLILAIEAAITGGSLSLIDGGGTEIAAWAGTSDISRAEDLLVNIDMMLTANGHSTRDLGLIAVSAGPGSFTGIRIGIATARGLATGLGVTMASESALKAMAWELRGFSELVSAVPVGRGSVCFQTFNTEVDLTETSGPHLAEDSVFLESLSSSGNSKFVLHKDLFEKANRPSGVEDFGKNVAKSVGLLCSLAPTRLADPMFISKQL